MLENDATKLEAGMTDENEDGYTRASIIEEAAEPLRRGHCCRHNAR